MTQPCWQVTLKVIVQIVFQSNRQRNSHVNLFARLRHYRASSSAISWYTTGWEVRALQGQGWALLRTWVEQYRKQVLYCRTGLPRTEISQLLCVFRVFLRRLPMTAAVTWQMFATVIQSNKVRTSRYRYMLSIIYWSKCSVSFVWRSCAEKISALVYTWCVILKFN